MKAYVLLAVITLLAALAAWKGIEARRWKNTAAEEEKVIALQESLMQKQRELTNNSSEALVACFGVVQQQSATISRAKEVVARINAANRR